MHFDRRPAPGAGVSNEHILRKVKSPLWKTLQCCPNLPVGGTHPVININGSPPDDSAFADYIGCGVRKSIAVLVENAVTINYLVPGIREKQKTGGSLIFF
jgi:hypothetical protein